MALRTDPIAKLFDGGRRLARRGGIVVALVVAGRAANAQNQTVFDRLNLDKLQLVSLGASYGTILPSQVEPTALYALAANYGEIARSWQIIFGVSYWESRYRDVVVQTLVDTLNENLDDPSGVARVVPSRVSLYDVTVSAEARYVPTYSGEVKPYLGVGFAAHVINAEGKLVDGTFIERSLDNIAAGLFITAGASIKVLPHFSIEGGGRADLLSGFRSTQVRAGIAYIFGHVRGTRPPSPGPSDGSENTIKR